MSKATGKNPALRIAVASGKGGTGKTTLSVALALSAEGPVNIVDCDVEEPNTSIFLSGFEGVADTAMTVPIPIVDEAKCNGCGACARLCQYNAIILLKKQAMIFGELCHSCGGCTLVCPTGAISEQGQAIGRIREARKGQVRFLEGELQVGHALSPPLIRELKKQVAAAPGTTILDCPPGTSCPMVTAVRGSDFVILVTEPTPFGLHDLRLAVATLRTLGLPFGVVINRSDSGDDRVVVYCGREGIPLLASIPQDRRVAEAYSRGENLLSLGSPYTETMAGLWSRIRAEAGA
jgi:MinD superfamily P-loop ATPase